jgi:hypothetical protein
VGTGDCQANGCYGGWYCNTGTCKCQSPPSTCGSSTPDAGSSGGGADAMIPTGGVTNTGGTVSRLFFAVVGDTRPAMENDNSGYPTAVITAIYDDLQNMGTRPEFAVATGDYNFSSTSSKNSTTQMNDYLGARAHFSNPVFYAMGNHECTGYTGSNCGQGNTDGITNNFNAFKTLMLGQVGQTQPYYSIPINSTDGSWTAKIEVVAANAWDSTQSAWLDTELAKSTTYTFIVRHEPTEANTAPGVTPSDTIIAKHPYTLLIVGHTHTYYHSNGAREVTMGLGGAPVTSSYNFGYLLVSQNSDGSVTVSEHDYDTNATNHTFTVTP